MDAVEFEDVRWRWDLNEELVGRFFIVFARFEYALKCSGYLRGDDEHAQADWNKFACDLGDAFDPDRTQRLRVAVDYLRNEPPRKQVVQGERLGWKSTGLSGNQLDALLVLVRHVRNNLFHGGKFHPVSKGAREDDLPERVLEPARDEELLGHSLVILAECLRLSPEVGEKFWKSLE